MDKFEERLGALEVARRKKEDEEHFVTRREFQEFVIDATAWHEKLHTELKTVKRFGWVLVVALTSLLLNVSPETAVDLFKSFVLSVGG